MKIRGASWRNGMGLDQIMAMLLVVLPVLVFSITIILDYWYVMQADYKLKLVANYVAEQANMSEDLSDFNVSDLGMCPSETSIVYSNQVNSGDSHIDIVIKYDYNGTYFDTPIATSMHTLSYYDKNMSIIGTCQ